MINNSESHSTHYIITTVDNELLISTESAMAEADAVSIRIKQNYFNVLNLHGTIFSAVVENVQKYSNQIT